jgi:hypothetical protein
MMVVYNNIYVILVLLCCYRCSEYRTLRVFINYIVLAQISVPIVLGKLCVHFRPAMLSVRSAKSVAGNLPTLRIPQ